MNDTPVVDRSVSDMKVGNGFEDMRMKLFTLWIFATLNYVYADVVTLFDKSVITNLSQTALLGAAVLVEMRLLWFSCPGC